MLACRFFRTDEGLLTGFELSGHVNGGSKGENLICAGATTLAQTCVSSVAFLLGRDAVVEKGDSGFLRFLLKGEPDTQTDLLLRSMVVGLQYLEKAGGKPGIRIEYASGGKIDGS